MKPKTQVTVIDNSDPDWWKGKVLGRVGYFPSKYCVRLNANEKPLQVTHNLQVSDSERGENLTLLRDQIVIQVRKTQPSNHAFHPRTPPISSFFELKRPATRSTAW